MLTKEHKQKRTGAALNFLNQYNKYGDGFQNHIVNGDETDLSKHSRNKTPVNKMAPFPFSNRTNGSKINFESQKGASFQVLVSRCQFLASFLGWKGSPTNRLHAQRGDHKCSDLLSDASIRHIEDHIYDIRSYTSYLRDPFIIFGIKKRVQALSIKISFPWTNYI